MPDDTTLPRAFQRAPVATDAHFFKLRVPLLDQGRMDTEVTRAKGMTARVKVYASGGENELHAHMGQDHMFIVLQGSVRFYDKDDGDLSYKLEGDYILAGDSSITIRYVRDITDVTKWDPLFCRVMAAQWAKDLAPAIAGSDGRMGLITAAWKEALNSARTVDAVEDGADPDTVPAWIAARSQG